MILGLGPDDRETIALSLGVAARAVAVALPLAVVTALLLTRVRFPGRTLLDAAVHAPLVLPPVVVGFALLLLFGAEGPAGRALDGLGVRLVFTTAGAALATGVMAFPLMVRAVRGALDGIDPAVETMAASLGAPWWDRLFTVTLPLAARGIVAAGVLGFAASLGEFGAVITFAANIPGETRTLPLAIYAALQVPGGEATAAALASVSLALALGALLLSEGLLRGIARTAGR